MASQSARTMTRANPTSSLNRTPPSRHTRWPGRTPDTECFPVNHASTNVRKTVWADLVSSPRPLIVAGYSSIGEIIDFVATWDRGQDTSQARVVLGTQPFPSTRRHFLDPTAEFTEHARDHWLDQGISLRLSSKVIGTMQALDEGRLDVRVVAGEWALHSKIYVGEDAATLGSSNFTGAGLGKQVEANARLIVIANLPAIARQASWRRTPGKWGSTGTRNSARC